MKHTLFRLVKSNTLVVISMLEILYSTGIRKQELTMPDIGYLKKTHRKHNPAEKKASKSLLF